jgi:hypothetical protein
MMLNHESLPSSRLNKKTIETMVDVGDEINYWLPYLQWVFIISRWMG